MYNLIVSVGAQDVPRWTFGLKNKKLARAFHKEMQMLFFVHITHFKLRWCAVMFVDPIGSSVYMLSPGDRGPPFWIQTLTIDVLYLFIYLLPLVFVC